MDTTLLQENIRLKDELEAAKEYIKELEIIKKKYMKMVDFKIQLMTENMPEGPVKEDFIKELLRVFF